MSQGRRASFVVRIVQDRRTEVSGVIERVATGAKEVFRGVEAIGPVIMAMLRGARVVPPAGSLTTAPRNEKPAPASALKGGSIRRDAAVGRRPRRG
jgi:hypothetical protein